MRFNSLAGHFKKFGVAAAAGDVAIIQNLDSGFTREVKATARVK